MIAFVPLLIISAIANVTPVEPTNLAQGAQYSFARPPSYEATSDANDRVQLTDGRFSSGQMWSSKEAVGWYAGAQPIVIDVDLSAVRALGQVCVRSARRQAAGVSFPASIDIFISNDGQEYGWVGDAAAGQDVSDGEYLSKYICSRELGQKARYVRLSVTARGTYFFADELRITAGSAASAHASALMSQNALQAFALERRSLATAVNALVSARRSLSPSEQKELREVQKQLLEGGGANPESLAALQERVRDAVRRSRQLPAGFDLVAADPWLQNSPFQPLEARSPGSALELVESWHGALAASVAHSAAKPIDVAVVARVSGPAAGGLRVRPYAVDYVLRADGMRVGDPLVPISKGRMRVPEGEQRQVWLDVSTTPGAAPGKAQITLTATADLPSGQISREVTFPVKIWPKPTVALEPATVVWGYLDSPVLRGAENEAVADMHAHGVNTAVLPTWDQPWPNESSTPNIIGDYHRFDSAMRSLASHRRYLFFLGLEEESSYRSLGGLPFMSDPWKARFIAWIREWSARVRRSGLDYDDFALYPIDEPGTPEERDLLVQLSRLAKTADRRIRIYTTLHRPELLSKELIAAVDIFQLNGDAQVPGTVATLRKAGKAVWSYETDSGKAADPARFYRAQGWRAFLNGLSGFGFWSYADTGQTGSAWSDIDDIRPDHAVVYESPQGILSSKRWEAWREGVQDYLLLSSSTEKARSAEERRQVRALAEQGAVALTDEERLRPLRYRLLELATGASSPR